MNRVAGVTALVVTALVPVLVVLRMRGVPDWVRGWRWAAWVAQAHSYGVVQRVGRAGATGGQGRSANAYHQADYGDGCEDAAPHHAPAIAGPPDDVLRQALLGTVQVRVIVIFMTVVITVTRHGRLPVF